MRIALVEDSIMDAKLLTRLIHKYYETHLGNLNHEPCQILLFKDHDSFYNGFLPDYFNLVFLDIYLDPELNGLEIAKRIRQGTKNPFVPIIFTSSSRDYAVESYDVEALGYLLKPIEFNALTTCLDRMHAQLSNKNLHSIYVMSNRQQIKIPVRNIQYVVSNGNGCSVVLTDDTIQTSMSVDAIQEALQEEDFIIAKRGHLVNLNYVAEVTNTHFVLHSGAQVPLKVKGAGQLKKTFKEFLLKKSNTTY